MVASPTMMEMLHREKMEFDFLKFIFNFNSVRYHLGFYGEVLVVIRSLLSL